MYLNVQKWVINLIFYSFSIYHKKSYSSSVYSVKCYKIVYEKWKIIRKTFSPKKAMARSIFFSTFNRVDELSRTEILMFAHTWTRIVMTFIRWITMFIYDSQWRIQTHEEKRRQRGREFVLIVLVLYTANGNAAVAERHRSFCAYKYVLNACVHKHRHM